MFAAKFRVGNPYLTGLWKGCPLFWTNPLWGAYLWPTRYWMLSIGSRRHGSRPRQALRFLAHRSVINASPRLRILKSFGCVLLDMSGQPDISPTGAFDARYVAFIETIAQLRPRLHRYCSRMTGSVMDGEDVVQDALFEAYRKLDQYDDSRPLVPWLFRIAHNRCIDFLRRRGVRVEAETTAMGPDYVLPAKPP